MKAELIDERVFTIKVGAAEFPGMRKVSTWNGLLELRNAKNEILIVSMPESVPAYRFDTLFNAIFRTAEETISAGVVVVMGTPSLIAQLRTSEPPQGELKPVPREPAKAG